MGSCAAMPAWRITVLAAFAASGHARTVVPHSRFNIGDDGVISLADQPGLRLNAAGGEMKAGDPLVLYPCSPHSHELFNMTAEGLIRLSSNPGLCLQAKGGLANGNEIVTYHCAQGGLARRHETFKMDSDGRIRSTVESDLCMNVKDAHLNSGGKLILWWCGKGPNTPNELFKYDGGMIKLQSNEALRFNVA